MKRIRRKTSERGVDFERHQTERRFRVTLSVLSGVMLGLSFPPFPLGILACFGLVPLLIVLGDIDRIRPSLPWIYLAFLVFHIITLNWTGGYAHANDIYMMIAGAATMLLHPLFYFIPMCGYVFVKRYLGGRAALVALPFLWVGYEYSHTLSEWSFPWLTIGNSQTYDLARIQFISATGVLGLSFWIIVINAIAFILYSMLAQRKRGDSYRRVAAWLVALLILYVLPPVHGIIELGKAPAADRLPADSGRTITVGLIQPNVDPWAKWMQGGTETVNTYVRMTRELLDRSGGGRPELVLWPETAVPYYLLTPANRAGLNEVRAQIDSLGVAVLTGLPHAIFYADPTKAPPSAKRHKVTGERYDSFNAAALIQPGVQTISWYGKMKMVPLAERVPYADFFQFIDFLQWGVGIGGWQIGPEMTVFVERTTGARFCSMICYESVYPAFVAAFVERGAEFIAIITIDSWWDRMSGAFQHQQFAILRAVENRRWVARCAMGGISCFIDPYGRVHDKTELFTQAALSRTIGRESELTFYTGHGDWLGDLSVVAAGLILAAAFGQRFKDRKREEQWQRNT